MLRMQQTSSQKKHTDAKPSCTIYIIKTRLLPDGAVHRVGEVYKFIPCSGTDDNKGSAVTIVKGAGPKNVEGKIYYIKR